MSGAPFSELGRELAAALRDRAPGEPRTTLFNLVVRGKRADAEALAQSLLGSRPARLVWIERTGAAESSGRVGARCGLDRQGRAACFEEFFLEEGLDGVAGDPGSWTPLLARGLPSFLLHLDDHALLPRFAAPVAELLDLCFVDGALAGGYVRTGAARSFLEARRTGLAIADFAWETLRQPRILAKELFDPMRDSFASLASLELSFGGAPGELFAAWVAERLGAGVAVGGNVAVGGADGLRFPMRDGSFFTVTLGEAPYSCEGGLSAIFGFGDGTTASFAVDASGAATLRFRDGTESMRDRAAELPCTPEEEALLRLVDMPREDERYVAALGLLAGS